MYISKTCNFQLGTKLNQVCHRQLLALVVLCVLSLWHDEMSLRGFLKRISKPKKLDATHVVDPIAFEARQDDVYFKLHRYGVLLKEVWDAYLTNQSQETFNDLQRQFFGIYANVELVNKDGELPICFIRAFVEVLRQLIGEVDEDSSFRLANNNLLFTKLVDALRSMEVMARCPTNRRILCYFGALDCIVALLQSIAPILCVLAVNMSVNYNQDAFEDEDDEPNEPRLVGTKTSFKAVTVTLRLEVLEQCVGFLYHFVEVGANMGCLEIGAIEARTPLTIAEVLEAFYQGVVSPGVRSRYWFRPRQETALSYPTTQLIPPTVPSPNPPNVITAIVATLKSLKSSDSENDLLYSIFSIQQTLLKILDFVIGHDVTETRLDACGALEMLLTHLGFPQDCSAFHYMLPKVESGSSVDQLEQGALPIQPEECNHGSESTAGDLDRRCTTGIQEEQPREPRKEHHRIEEGDGKEEEEGEGEEEEEEERPKPNEGHFEDNGDPEDLARPGDRAHESCTQQDDEVRHDQGIEMVGETQQEVLEGIAATGGRKLIMGGNGIELGAAQIECSNHEVTLERGSSAPMSSEVSSDQATSPGVHSRTCDCRRLGSLNLPNIPRPRLNHHFNLQVKVLELIGSLISHHPRSIYALNEYGLTEQLVEMASFTALYFSAFPLRCILEAACSCKQPSSGASAGAKDVDAAVLRAQMVYCHREVAHVLGPPPALADFARDNVQMGAFFSQLSDLANKAQVVHGYSRVCEGELRRKLSSAMNMETRRAQSRSRPTAADIEAQQAQVRAEVWQQSSEVEQWKGLARELQCVPLQVFAPCAVRNPNLTLTRSSLQHVPELQVFFLDSVIQLLQTAAALPEPLPSDGPTGHLASLVSALLYDVLFSNTFYFLAPPSPHLDPAVLRPLRRLQELIHEAVIYILKAMATQIHHTANDAELACLLQVLQDHGSQPEVVCQVSNAILYIVRNNFEPTLPVLLRQQGLEILCQCFQTQHALLHAGMSAAPVGL